MYLKKLEIYGFKSFADRIQMSFGDGITGVVGPNGSGKSNIADAVRWVLGEQSARTLRGNRMEDVIFAGSDKRKALGFCEVMLTFDNEDGALPVSFAEVMITRRVYRNGESEYQLNRAACRLKDIVELFRDTGIGKEGYSIIGQGRIDEILSARSEDRRRVFEEAAGIVKYLTRREEAERRLDATAQNLSRVDDLLEELKRQLGPLNEAANKARHFLRLRDQLKELELAAFLEQYDRIEQRANQYAAQHEGLLQQSAANEAKRQESAKRRAEAAQRLNELTAQLAKAHEEQLETTRAAQTLEGELNVDRERSLGLERDTARLCEEIESVKGRQAAISRDAGDGESAKNLREQELSQLKQQGELRDSELFKAQKEAETAEEELETLKNRRIEAMNRAANRQMAQARLTAMHESLLGRSETVAELTNAAQAAAPALENVLGGAEEAQKLAVNTLEAARAERKAAQEAVKSLDARVEELRAHMQRLEGTRRDNASRLNLLREMARDYEGYQHAVKQVMQEARRRGLDGVRDVVASLLKVPREYERAIEMSLGGQMQNVVVDREEDAKVMIEYLRSGRLGRATFLPISAMRPRLLNQQERGVLSMPGCVGVASELVEFDDRYRGVVDSLLGRTVIATDLTHGIEIHRRAGHVFRLVTLEGDVMHSGGSMTGGSVQSRTTSLLAREREIDECQRMIAQLEEQFAEAKLSLDDVQQRRGEVAASLETVIERERQDDIAVARDTERLNSAREACKAHEERLAALLLEAEQLAEQLADVELELAEAIKAPEAGGESVDAQIALAQERAQKARAALDMAREAQTAARVSYAAAEREWAAAGRDSDRLAEEGRALEARFSGLGVQLAETKDKLGQLARLITEKQLRLGEVNAQLERVTQGVKLQEQARDEAQEKERALGDEAEQIARELADAQERAHRAELSLQRARAEIESLCARIWEDYELSYAQAEPWRKPNLPLQETVQRVDAIKAEIRAMGDVYVGAVEEHKQVSQRIEEISAQQSDLIAAQTDLRGIIEELTRKMQKRFREEFDKLNEYFGQTFARLFGGGMASLKLQDENDVLGCGIDIVAQPPGKKLQLLSLLSGGERALTAIAILFAMLRLKPTPFCILDEIEAALDEANIGNFASFLAEFSKNTQFVVVTHRKGTMERCDALYGVAMEERGVSRMVSVSLQ